MNQEITSLDKKYNQIFCLVCMVFVFFSCTKDIIPISKPDEVANYPKITIPNYSIKGTEKYLSKNSDYVFNQEEVRTYNLIIRDADLAKLNANPALEEYVEAALVFEGDTISPIGVRYKGSIGTFSSCLDGPDWRFPSGRNTCTKLSMQFKINWNNRKERFYDQNKLQFHAQNYDKSQLRERLGYWLFNQMGVPAPRAVHTRLLINGQYNGLYGLIEEIDNRFVDYNYKNGKGNVYKEVWPLQIDGLQQTDKAFLDALKTNEGEGADIHLMREFANALANGNESKSKEVVSKYMDINAIVSYIVVDRAIKHDDGPFHWYCDGVKPCNNHNYYWFEDQKNKKIHIIPWDLDGAFEKLFVSPITVTSIVDKWGMTSNNCLPFYYGNIYFKQLSACCEKLTSNWAKFDEEYLVRKKILQEVILSDEKAISQIQLWHALLTPFIKEADNFYNFSVQSEANKKATTFENWNTEVNTLIKQVKTTRVMGSF